MWIVSLINGNSLIFPSWLSTDNKGGHRWCIGWCMGPFMLSGRLSPPPLTIPKPFRVELGENDLLFLLRARTLQHFQLIAAWSIFCKIGSQAKFSGFQVCRQNLNQLDFIGNFCMQVNLVVKLKPVVVSSGRGCILRDHIPPPTSLPLRAFWILKDPKRNLPDYSLRVSDWNLSQWRRKLQLGLMSLSQIFREIGVMSLSVNWL